MASIRDVIDQGYKTDLAIREKGNIGQHLREVLNTVTKSKLEIGQEARKNDATSQLATQQAYQKEFPETLAGQPAQDKPMSQRRIDSYSGRGTAAFKQNLQNEMLGAGIDVNVDLSNFRASMGAFRAQQKLPQGIVDRAAGIQDFGDLLALAAEVQSMRSQYPEKDIVKLLEVIKESVFTQLDDKQKLLLLKFLKGE